MISSRRNFVWRQRPVVPAWRALPAACVTRRVYESRARRIPRGARLKFRMRSARDRV